MTVVNCATELIIPVIYVAKVIFNYLDVRLSGDEAKDNVSRLHTYTYTYR